VLCEQDESLPGREEHELKEHYYRHWKLTAAYQTYKAARK